jgi:hypothetical protein
MKIISFDAGYAKTGLAVLDEERIIEYGLILTEAEKQSSPKENRFHRIGALRASAKKLIEKHAPDHIVIELTDWNRGSRDSRDSWIVETSARESLAIATTALFALCLELNIKPIVLGPREWMRELGVQDKAGAASYVAMLFRDHFEQTVRTVTSRKSNKARSEVVIIDTQTKRPVPLDVTDAVAMGVVARNRLRVLAMSEDARG